METEHFAENTFTAEGNTNHKILEKIFIGNAQTTKFVKVFSLKVSHYTWWERNSKTYKSLAMVVTFAINLEFWLYTKSGITTCSNLSVYLYMQSLNIYTISSMSAQSLKVDCYFLRLYKPQQSEWERVSESSCLNHRSKSTCSMHCQINQTYSYI